MDGDHTNFLDFCNNCINMTNDDALFVDPGEDDYHLDTLSIAEGKALPLMSITKDLDNVDRDGTAPDLGCYEYIFE